MLHPFLYADIKSYASRVSPLTLTDIAMPRPMAVTAREGEARTIRSLPLDLHTAFPVSEEKIYLSICDSTVLAQSVRAAVDRFLDQVMYWREERSPPDSVGEAPPAKIAALLGGPEGGVRVVKNSLEGIKYISTPFY